MIPIRFLRPFCGSAAWREVLKDQKHARLRENAHQAAQAFVLGQKERRSSRQAAKPQKDRPVD
jgi:hypothetical protein